jgi:hypothetical protein
MYEIVLKCALSDFVQVNHPAASSGAWKLKRPKGRGIDPRGIRQIAMLAWLFSSLFAGINELTKTEACHGRIRIGGDEAVELSDQ